MSDTATLDADARPLTSAGRYLREVKDYDEWTRDWCKLSEDIVKRYRDTRMQRTRPRRVNILWSNVQTLQPAIIARPPKPVVERRFRDKDPIAKEASDVLERCVAAAIDSDAFMQVLAQVRDDRLLPGRGAAWVRYEPTISETGNPEAPEKLDQETIAHDYVAWRDFGHNRARCWAEVYIVWRKLRMSRADLRKRFGKIAEDVPLDLKPDVENEDQAEAAARTTLYSRATVYEMWDKRNGKIVWVAKEFPSQVLDEKPGVGLADFFPCPRPFYATLTTDSLIPVPDYHQYEAQARELDEINARLHKLVEACKVRGVFNGEFEGDLTRSLFSGDENRIFKVKDWASFAAKGGIEGAISWLPLDMIVTAIKQLTERAEVLRNVIYEVTGIADIIRGSSDASETATAQRIKGQFAALRLQDTQREMARFARDYVALTAELISEHFDQRTIFEMAGVDLPTDAQVQQKAQQAMQQALMAAQQGGDPAQAQHALMAAHAEAQKAIAETVTQEKVVALLRNDRLRSFRIEIETDSTVAVDEEADKASAVEFTQAMGVFLKEALPMAQVAPELLPLFKEQILYTARRFKAGRAMEGAIAQVFEALEKRGQAQAQQGPPPDPAMVKAQADVAAVNAKTQAQVQGSQMKLQAEMQRDQAKFDAETQMAQMEFAADQQRMNAQHQGNMALAEFDAQTNAQATATMADARAKATMEAAKRRPEGRA